MEIKTNNGKKGGTLKGKPHYDKNGKPVGGIKAVVTDAGGKPVQLEGGEVIINKEASRIHWKKLSEINQSAGGGVPIEKPSGADDDPEEYRDGGNVIKFNPNHVPNKSIVKFALTIKNDYPEIWKLGGNIFGNEAFDNLKRVSERGYWLDSEEWMYIKWRSYVARHKKDFRIEGVVAMLKWCEKVEKGWAYMRDLIEKKAGKKLTSTPRLNKLESGGSVGRNQYKTIAFFSNKKFKIFDGKKTFSKIKKDYGITPVKLQHIIVNNSDANHSILFEKWSEKELKNKFNEFVDDSLIYSVVNDGKYNIIENAYWHNQKTNKKYFYDTENIAWMEEKTMAQGGSLNKGINVESEHKDVYDTMKKYFEETGRTMPITEKEFYEMIAKEHISENPDYYDLLEKYVENKEKGGAIEPHINIEEDIMFNQFGKL